MITSDLLQPVVETIKGSITAALPVGLTIFGLMIGPDIAIKMIKKGKRG